MERKLMPNEYFYLANGTVLKNIYDLLHALKKMDEQTFTHHVNTNKNDFAKWINDVFQLPELAQKLNKLISREEIRQEIQAELARQKAKKYLDDSHPYFPVKQQGFKAANQVKEEPAIKKIDQILKKEQELEEKTEEIEHKIDSQSKILTHEFWFGFALGAAAILVVMFLYTMFA